MVERETGRSLKCILTDNGGVYIGAFDEYCKSHGIRHERTCPKSSPQNGIAERMNRTIVERIRSMLSHAKLPKSFWAEGIQLPVGVLSFPSIPSDLSPLPAGSVPSVPSLPSVGSDFEVQQPAPIQPLDDTKEPYNQPNGYWYTRRILIDYLKADMDTNFDRTPSYSKYRRVFELVVGPNYKSQTRLVEVLADIANNPENNPTIERARRIMNSIYQLQIKDRDLDSYEFHD